MPGGLAARVAGWDKWRTGYAPGPILPAGETPGSIKVELFIAEQWVDVTRLDRDTPGVYYRDSIVITRGKSDEAAQLDRGTCRFTLNNRDGRFSPRNPLSPYYGKLVRNTPCRVSVVQSTGERWYRFYGEVSSWPQRWDKTGNDVYVQVEASGILRRLGRGSSPLSSPLYRGYTRDVDHLVAYWPCEDASSATSIASAVAGGKAMTISGTPTLASDSTNFVASSPLPVMGSASFTGYVPTYTPSLDKAQVRFLMAIPAAGATNGQIICSVYTTGNVPRWEFYYGTGGALGLRGFDTTDANVADTGLVVFPSGVNGTPLRVSLEFTRSAGTLSATIVTAAPGASTGDTTGTSVTATLGRITRIILARSKGLTTTTLGHLSVQSKVASIFDLGSQLQAYNGEHAGNRIARLCAEEGVNYARIQPQANSMAMGYQDIDTLVSLIRDCVDADMGRLLEPRDQIGFAYRDRETLYDQTAQLALSYSGHELADSLDPVDDDQYTRNDVTIKRDNGGSSVRATKDTGALSIAEVGRYDTSTTLNVETDPLLPDLAGWILHLGTTDEARYPSVALNLAHSTFTDDDAMMTAALGLEIGDLVTIDDLPSWLPPDQIGLIVEGYTETLNGIEHTMTLNCSPESPHHIAVYDNSAWRYESDGSTLTSDLGTTDVSVNVTIPDGPVWSVTDGSFDINIGGERMTVTGISGSSSPQTFTVTRSVNGVTKAHYAGDSVSLFTPAFYAI